MPSGSTPQPRNSNSSEPQGSSHRSNREKSSKTGSLTRQVAATTPGAVAETGSPPGRKRGKRSGRHSSNDNDNPDTPSGASPNVVSPTSNTKQALSQLNASTVPPLWHPSTPPNTTSVQSTRSYPVDDDTSRGEPTESVGGTATTAATMTVTTAGAVADMPQIVAQLAPTEEDVEARIAAQLRKDIQRELEQSMNAQVVYPTATVAEEQPNHHGYRNIIALLLLLVVAGIVGVVVALTRDDTSTIDNTATTAPVNLRQEYLLEVLEPYVSNMSWLGDLALPQGQGFQWLVEDDEFTSHSQKLSSTQILLERYALAVLYYATSGPNWPIEYSFLDGTTSACEWNNGGRPGEEEADGIYCTDSTQFGIVTFLRLHEGEQLAGSLPTEVGLLSSLQHISLDGNALTGTLPSEIGNLSGLQVLTLADNVGLMGPLPVEWANLTSLNSLWLTNTTLTGSMNELFCTLDYTSMSLSADCEGESPEMECSCCQVCCSADGEQCLSSSFASETPTWLPGPTNLPTSEYRDTFFPLPGEDTPPPTTFFYLLETLGPYIMRNETALYDRSTPQSQALLWLSDEDNFSADPGSMEVETLLERYVLALLYFATYGSQWSIDFSFLDTTKSVCDWSDMDEESQGDDIITGVHCNSTDIDGISFVTHLNLQGVGMFGAIPWELSLLEHLVVLQLDYNDLTGPLPSELSTLPAMKTLSVGSNYLRGPLPSNWSSSVEEIIVTSNYLTGTIPTEWGNSGMKNLTVLQCGLNQLQGTIPTDLATLSSLQKMDLEANRLTGIIPTEIGLLSTVEHLYLEKNELSGTLPSEIGNLSSLQTFYIYGNPGITGTVPSEFEGLQSLESFSFENTTLSGSVDAIFCPIYEGESLSLYGDCLGLNPEIECSCCAICCEPDGENCEYMIYAAKVTSGGMSVPVMGTTTLVLFHLLLVWLPLALIL